MEKLKLALNKTKEYVDSFEKNLSIPKKTNCFLKIIISSKEKKDENGILYIKSKEKTSKLEEERVGESICNLVKSYKTKDVSIFVESEIKNFNLGNSAIGFLLTNFEFDLYKENKTKYKIYFDGTASDKTEFKNNKKLAESIILCRYLSLMCADDVNPDSYEEFVRYLFKNRSDIKIESVDLEKHKLSLIQAVGRSSKYKPRLLVLKKEKNPKLALIGKGITYDTGGLSLKPSDSMIEMYTDMAGSAIMLSTLNAIESDKDFYVLLPITENAIGGASYRPGDVIPTAAGYNVEIGNTDAEGRLVLADATHYATSVLNCSHAVCVATLTGLALYIFGKKYACMISNDKKFASVLEKSFEEVGDGTKELPSDEYYANLLRKATKRGDFNNISNREAGTIVALKFIEFFAKKGSKFAAIDVAASLDLPNMSSEEVLNCRPVASFKNFVENYLDKLEK